MATTADLPIITAPSDPAVLANSESTPPSMDSPNTSPAGSAPKAKTKAKTPEEEELERQIEALAVPGFSLHQEGVFTVVRKVQKTGRSRTFPARLARWLLQSDKWLPLLFRYIKESFFLAPWRMCILILYRTLKSQVPLARLWASARIRTMVEQAIETGHVDKLRLSLFVALAGFLTTGFRSIQVFFAKNTGILERKFGAMLTSRLLGVMAGLDYPAATDPMNNKLIQDAARTVQAGSDKAFNVVADVIKVFTSLAGVMTQAEYLRRSLTRDNIDMFAIGLVANFVKSAEWLFLGDSGVYSGVTNIHYHRMEHLWSEAKDRVPEDNLLGLPSYYHQEYDKADTLMGDLWTSRLREPSSLRRATAYLNSFSTPTIYAMFALRASSRRAAGGLRESFTTDMLNFIETATSSLAEEIGNFFYVLDDVRQHCSEILQYYRVMDLKPRMKVPEVPARYERQVIKMDENGIGISGMSIEFRDVEYRYPDSEKTALSGVNFSIKPGTLVCIVGYNGAGKSTLINMMTRIVDPTAGTVLINGTDAKEYDPKNLYSRISCQFQETFPADVTIREWLHMGDVTDVHDEEKMQECLRITGADKIIAEFPKGLDARLGPYPADDTPQSLLKEYIQETKTGGYDPWEANYDLKFARQIEQEEEYEDDVTNSSRLKNKDCAFSPGQWSKLVFARALMRKSADLRIFDEPTAKLDPIASRAAFDQIEKLRGTCTVVHITHDLSACLKADQVILFEDGCNVESGTHEDLLAQADSKYRQFYMASLGHENDSDDNDREQDTDQVEETGEESEIAESQPEVLTSNLEKLRAAQGHCQCAHHDELDSGHAINDKIPKMIFLSMFGNDDDHEELSESVEHGFAQLDNIGLDVTPEDPITRFEEIDEESHKGDAEEAEEVEGVVEEAAEDDDGNDSGFEASSQSSFCTELPRGVHQDQAKVV